MEKKHTGNVLRNQMAEDLASARHSDAGNIAPDPVMDRLVQKMQLDGDPDECLARMPPYLAQQVSTYQQSIKRVVIPLFSLKVVLPLESHKANPPYSTTGDRLSLPAVKRSHHSVEPRAGATWSVPPWMYIWAPQMMRHFFPFIFHRHAF